MKLNSGFGVVVPRGNLISEIWSYDLCKLEKTRGVDKVMEVKSTKKGWSQTREKLITRGVQCQTSCPFCEGENESDWHILFECQEAIKVWEYSEIWP